MNRLAQILHNYWKTSLKVHALPKAELVKILTNILEKTHNSATIHLKLTVSFVEPRWSESIFKVILTQSNISL